MTPGLTTAEKMVGWKHGQDTIITSIKKDRAVGPLPLCLAQAYRGMFDGSILFYGRLGMNKFILKWMLRILPLGQEQIE